MGRRIQTTSPSLSSRLYQSWVVRAAAGALAAGALLYSLTPEQRLRPAHMHTPSFETAVEAALQYTNFEARVRSLMSPRKVPDFKMKDLHGDWQSISQYKGKTIVLNFWGTWCPPCKAEMPALERLADAYPDLVVLGMNVEYPETTIADVLSFVNKNEIHYPNVLLHEQGLIEQYEHVGPGQDFSLPHTYVIDSKGMQRIEYIGAVPFDQKNIRDAILSVK